MCGHYFNEMFIIQISIHHIKKTFWRVLSEERWLANLKKITAVYLDNNNIAADASIIFFFFNKL